MPERLILNFKGTAGQSFGCWNAKGLELNLKGLANDYVGKGMNGGKIVITKEKHLKDDRSVLLGNTCLFGATGGEFYANGVAGERFAVRNSGAKAIIEGAGDHCCEYMTGGEVIVLGSVGNNFGAGMTGGFAYVFDEDRSFCLHQIHMQSLLSFLHQNYSQLNLAQLLHHQSCTHNNGLLRLQ